ncbi:MAG: hypothetical protein AAGC49_00280 [Brevundimonas sp.]
MNVRRWSLCVAATLALGTLAVPAAEAATGPNPAPVTTADEITVTPDAKGSTLTWHPADGLPMGDARPEFRVAGRALGVPVERGDALRLRVAGVTSLRASQVSVVSGGRVLAGAAAGKGAAAATKVPTVPAVSKVLPKDPGTPGKYKVSSFTYQLPSVTIPGYAHKVEMRGRVIAPVSVKGHRPVVLFLHGRHATCYTPGSDEPSIDWPCAPGMKPIPSYLGYVQQQRLLASQGFVTVSISANGINGQDGDDIDSGAAARAILVRRHLDLLTDWNAGKGAGPAERTQLAGHLNMRKVMTVGHSRGGEGVDRAALKARATDRFTIVGQVLVAPTDFGQQVAVGIPTTVLLPYCDGDVSDLQGQMFVDQGARLAAGDRALKSSVLVVGANHNYFNSQWTPGVAAAPANDDWWDDTDAVCGTKAPQRLTGAQQRAVGSAYIAAAARTYLTSDVSARPLLDGTSVRAASAGKAVVLTHATGGRRVPLVLAGSAPVVKVGKNATASVCAVYAQDEASLCDRSGSTFDSPHWSPQAWGAFSSAPKVIKVGWTAKNARVALTPTRALGSSRYLDLRVVVPSKKFTPSFDVLVRDAKGKVTALPPLRAVSVLPGSVTAQGWAQDVRVVLPKGTVLGSGASIVLRSTSSRGQVMLLDVYGSAAGLVPSTASVQTVPVLDVPAATLLPPAGHDVKTAVLQIPVRSVPTIGGTVEVRLLDPQTGSGDAKQYAIRAGQKSLDVTVTRPPWDDAYTDAASGSGSLVLVRAVRNAVVDGYVGVVAAASGAVRPHFVISQPAASAAPGESLRWEIRLSGPVSNDIAIPITAVAPSAAPSELAGLDLLPGWALRNLNGPATDRPISEIGLQQWLYIPAFTTSATFEIPIRQGVTFTGQRQIVLRADTSEFGAPTTILTGTVTTG